jgi:hypothetical protein
MSNTAASTPLDVWTSSTNNIKPQIVDQVALGVFKNFGPDANNYESSIEVYYKDMQNQIDYADRASLFLNPYFEKDLLFGKGRAYGIEFFLKKNVGKLTGCASYTIARTESKIEGLNNNEWYKEYEITPANHVEFVDDSEFPEVEKEVNEIIKAVPRKKKDVDDALIINDSKRIKKTIDYNKLNKGL